MNNHYSPNYLKGMETLQKQYWEKENEIAQKKTDVLRFVVTTLSVVFGILVSLGSRSSEYQEIRLCFAIGVSLLALSILFLGVSLQAELYYMKKGNKLFEEEIKKAFAEYRPVFPVYVQKNKIFGICETTGYICCVLFLLCLCVFAFLQVFFS